MMRQKNESQVVADRPRIAGICVVDAGPYSVEDERPRMREQPLKASGREHEQAQPLAAMRRRPAIAVAAANSGTSRISLRYAQGPGCSTWSSQC